jgi:hypothetical protein
MERKPYVIWKVKDVEYKLKLTTAAITELEDKLKGNLLLAIQGSSLPSLRIALTIAHAGFKKYEHGITYKDVEKLFDEYLDEGGSQTAFLTDVLSPLYEVSGFFSEAQADTMGEKMEEAKSTM